MPKVSFKKSLRERFLRIIKRNKSKFSKCQKNILEVNAENAENPEGNFLPNSKNSQKNFTEMLHQQDCG